MKLNDDDSWLIIDDDDTPIMMLKLSNRRDFAFIKSFANRPFQRRDLEKYGLVPAPRNVAPSTANTNYGRGSFPSPRVIAAPRPRSGQQTMSWGPPTKPTSRWDMEGVEEEEQTMGEKEKEPVVTYEEDTPMPDATKGSGMGGGSFSFPQGGLFGASSNSVDPEGYLRDLDQWQAEQANARRQQPAGRTIRSSKNNFQGASSGSNNQDCVLASMGTALGVMPKVLENTYFEKTGKTMTATDEAIVEMAGMFGLVRCDTQVLEDALSSGKKGFIRAEAISGDGWHAYCAIAITADQFVVAWDPDTEVGKKCREIPVELIDPNTIFITK